MIGYPLLIAGASIVFGAQWSTVLVLVQIILSVFATWHVYLLANDLSKLRLVGLCAAGVYALSYVLVVDLFLLSDSLYNSLGVIIVCRLALAHLQNGPAKSRMVALLGALVALAFLLREFQLYQAPLILPFVIAYSWRTEHRAAARIALVLKFVLPLTLVAVAYQTWNVVRTGERFITTGPQTAAVWALAKLAEQGTSVFNGHSPVDLVARETFKTFEFAEVGQFNERMWRDYELNGIHIAREAQSKFYSTAVKFPIAVLTRSLYNLVLVEWIFRPGFIPLRDAVLREDTCFGASPPQGYASNLCNLEAQTYIPSRRVFLLFIVLVPTHLIAMVTFWVPLNQRMQTAACLWTAGVGSLVLYSFVNMEIRYVLTTLAFMLAVLALYVGWFVEAAQKAIYAALYQIRALSITQFVLRAYIVMALVTLGFQTYVRSIECYGYRPCALSLSKGVVWSAIWPASWTMYVWESNGVPPLHRLGAWAKSWRR
jgi:hypothetical protein